MKSFIKRHIPIIVAVGVILLIGTVAYAVSILFGESSATQNFTQDHWVEMGAMADGAEVPVRPGRTVPVNTLKAEVDSSEENTFLFMGLTMPVFGETYLYEANLEPGWIEVARGNDGTDGNTGTIVYGCGSEDGLVNLGRNTQPGVLAKSLTVANIDKDAFMGTPDINVTVHAWTVAGDGVDEGNAWKSVNSQFGIIN